MAGNSSATRRAFDLIATNVAVITVADSAGVHGCTANAWAEACEPPLLLVTLRRDSATRARIEARRRFAVNLLADDQVMLARRFARVNRRFAGVRYQSGPLGQPLLDDVLATFECEVEGQHPFGAMEIVVGRVHDASARSEAAPLLFFARRFFAGPGRRIG